MRVDPWTRSLSVTLLLAASAAAASATTFGFSATLDGSKEVPPVATAATGFAQVSFNDATDTVSVFESFSGLSSPSSASHIHCCTATAGAGTAPVVVPFVSFPSVTAGTYTHDFQLAADSFAQLLAGTRAGLAYVNIHDAVNPGGEIQGFLVAAPVPEPTSVAMLVAGLGALGLAVRRRRAG